MTANGIVNTDPEAREEDRDYSPSPPVVGSDGAVAPPGELGIAAAEEVTAELILTEFKPRVWSLSVALSTGEIEVYGLRDILSRMEHCRMAMRVLANALDLETTDVDIYYDNPQRDRE